MAKPGFGSPRSLNLQLICTSYTLTRNMLDVCPPLPLYILSIWSDANVDNIVALLEHQNRVCRIDISISSLDTSNFSLISYPTTATTVTYSPPGSASHTNSNSNSNSTSHLPPHALQSARDARLPRLADHRSPHDSRRRSALRRADAPQNDRVRARTPPSKEALHCMFANVPGHKRTESIPGTGLRCAPRTSSFR